MAQSTHSSSKIDNLADNAAGTVKDLAGQAQDVASRVADQGREATEGVQEVAGNIKGAIDKSVSDQPMATLAMAAMVGSCSARSGSPERLSRSSKDAALMCTGLLLRRAAPAVVTRAKCPGEVALLIAHGDQHVACEAQRQ